MGKHNVGRIVLSEESLVKSLGFPKGKLHFVGKSDDYLGVAFMIEHPDMPEVAEGEEVPRVDIVCYRFIPDTDYLATGGFIRRLFESWRAFKTIWTFMAKNKKYLRR